MPAKSSTIFSAVLAAGSASRFGSSKLAAELRGVPLLRIAVDAATEVCGNRVITVVGHDWMTAMALLKPYSGFVVVNEDYRQGMGSSIAAAARACRGRADAFLLLLADQPLVTARDLKRLIAAWARQPQRAAASRYGGRLGIPAVLPRRLWRDARRASGDVGARELLRRPGARITSASLPAAGIDIDTHDDLVALGS